MPRAGRARAPGEARVYVHVWYSIGQRRRVMDRSEWAGGNERADQGGAGANRDKTRTCRHSTCITSFKKLRGDRGGTRPRHPWKQRKPRIDISGGRERAVVVTK